MKKILIFAWACFFILIYTQSTAQRSKLVLKINEKAPARVVSNSSPGQQRTTSCAVDSIVLTTQSQIDNFSTTYPSCTTPSYLVINGAGASPAITNLNGLLVLNEVTKKLDIRNTSVTSLSGLNNLNYIGDSMWIANNPLMIETGLYNLNKLHGVFLRNLPLLTSLDGLTNNVDSIGELQIDSTGLTDIDGLLGIEHATAGISIDHSPDLTSISGLANLMTLQGWISLSNLPSLTSLGIHNLQQSYGFLFSELPNLLSLEDIGNHLVNTNISTFWMINTGITTLSGLDSITSVPNFYLWNNQNLVSTHGLEKIAGNVGYGISLINNPLLTNVSALKGITSVNDGTVEIVNLPLLSDMDGFGNIQNIGHGLLISDNPLIDSLNFLDSNLVIQNNPYNNSQVIVTDNVRIRDNPQLSVCAFRPICNYLAGGGIADIFNNAPGCNDLSEVFAACNIDTTCAIGNQLTWNGNNSDDWNDPDNWNPAGVPGNCTTVTIPDAFNVSNSPFVYNDIFINGLIMQQGSTLDLNNHNLYVADTFDIEYAVINSGNAINIPHPGQFYVLGSAIIGELTATRAFAPYVHDSYFGGNFKCLDYSGQTEFINNTFDGNTVLSDSTGRVDGSAAFFNTFNGDLSITNNSDYGQMYLSNASPGHDYVDGNLTIINHTTATISVGLGGGNPLWVNGDFIVDCDNGGVEINNLTFTDSKSSRITQAGSVPISINNLYMQKYGYLILDQTVEINNRLEFGGFSGQIITDPSRLLVLNNGAVAVQQQFGGVVVGPLKKIGNQAFTFPIGEIESNTIWKAPLSMSAPSLPTDEFTAEYFHRNPSTAGYDTSLYTPGFGGISGKEYWKLERNIGNNSKVKVTLSYDSARSGPSFLYQYMQVAGWNGNLWRSWSSGGFSGQIYGGTVISGDSLTEYGPLTLSFKPIRKPVITMSNLDSVRCLNTGFYVKYTADTAMIAGNTMRVEVSDTSGNFNNFFNPTFGSKVTSAASDSIFFLSFALLPNKNYKIRVVGNLPPDTSINTKNITFRTTPNLLFNVIGPTPTCLGSGPQKYYPDVHEAGVTYSWTISGGGSLTTNGDTAIVTWGATGNFSLTIRSSNLCGNGPLRTIFVLVNPPAPTATPTINNTGRWLYASQAPVNAGYSWYRNAVLIPGANSASYYASLAGNYTARYSNFCGSGPVSNAISFAADALPQSINFPAITNRTYGDLPFTPTASSTSGLPVSFSVVSGPATINSQTNLLTIIGTGLVTIIAKQQGDNVYDTAAYVTRSFTVNKASQVITFAAIPDQNFSEHLQTDLGRIFF